jgi:hypothetical protein
MLLVVPCRSPRGAGEVRLLSMSEEGETSENSPKSERRCGSSYRQRSDPTASASRIRDASRHLLEGRFHLPAHNKSRENLLRIDLEVGTHRRAWVLNSPLGSRTKTQRRGTANKPALYHTAVSVKRSQRYVPRSHTRLSDRDGSPDGGRIFGHLRKVGQSFALEARSSYLARFARDGAGS